MESQSVPLLKKFDSIGSNRIFLGIIAASIVLGLFTGFLLSKSNKTSGEAVVTTTQTPNTAQQDAKTFRDFAQGTVQKRPAPKNPEEYVEGTHFLVRQGSAPVALTSSVVDLSEYEGKKVKVFGETQKAVKEGWLMDVGRVEEE